nr:hypothetical protein [Tanacetum cinerariifolium]
PLRPQRGAARAVPARPPPAADAGLVRRRGGVVAAAAPPGRAALARGLHGAGYQNPPRAGAARPGLPAPPGRCGGGYAALLQPLYAALCASRRAGSSRVGSHPPRYSAAIWPAGRGHQGGPRKNLGNLLRAFGLFKAQGGAEEIQLLLVGREAWRAGPIFEAYQSLPPAVQAAVRFTGRVSEADLAGLYAAALATAYVPFFEGFGLPVVEAQASGCPVLTSGVSSLPEVAGGAAGAFLCNPAEPAAIADGLAQLSQNAALRARLRAAGLANVARFAWARTADVLWQAVQEAIAQASAGA